LVLNRGAFTRIWQAHGLLVDAGASVPPSQILAHPDCPVSEPLVANTWGQQI